MEKGPDEQFVGPLFYGSVNGRRLTISSIDKSFGRVNHGPLLPVVSTNAMNGRRPSIRHSNTRLPRWGSATRYLRACWMRNLSSFCRIRMPAAATAPGNAIPVNQSSNPSCVRPDRASAFHSYQRCTRPRFGKLSISISKGSVLKRSSLVAPRPFQNNGHCSQLSLSGVAIMDAVIATKPTNGL